MKSIAPQLEEVNFARRVLQNLNLHRACALGSRLPQLRLMVLAALCGNRRALDDFMDEVTRDRCGMAIFTRLNRRLGQRAAA